MGDIFTFIFNRSPENKIFSFFKMKGMTDSQWGAILFASLIVLITLPVLYHGFGRDPQQEHFLNSCFLQLVAPNMVGSPDLAPYQPKLPAKVIKETFPPTFPLNQVDAIQCKQAGQKLGSYAQTTNNGPHCTGNKQNRMLSACPLLPIPTPSDFSFCQDVRRLSGCPTDPPLQISSDSQARVNYYCSP